jgi:hypothetical protein
MQDSDQFVCRGEAKMDVLISVIAVVAASSCFAAIVTAEWRDRKKRRMLEADKRRVISQKAPME